MATRLVALAALLVALGLGAAPGRGHAQGGSTDIIPGRYVVVLKDGVANPGRVAADLAARYGLAVEHVYEHVLPGFAAAIPDPRLPQVRADPRVLFVAADRVLRPFAQVLPTGVDRVQADLSSAAAGDGRGMVNVDVAVLDSGIDPAHPDLNVEGGYNCTGPDRAAWADARGHGSHVAGIIGARDDATGVVGVAPGARLWAVKIVNDLGVATDSTALCGIDWVTRHRSIEVANMSLGGTGLDDGNCGRSNLDALHLAICRSVAAGVTYVVAAGNAATDAGLVVPAAYDEVITVSALADYDGRPGGGASPTCDAAADDTFPVWSNHGADVDLGAPGVCILSAYKQGGYQTLSGTSMAAPHVAGAAALYLAAHRRAGPGDVRAALTSPANSEALGAGHTDPSGRHPEPVLQARNF